MDEMVKVVVFVPETHADQIRKVLGTEGAGKIGNYDFASFSSQGTGRFRPLKGAKPAVGEVGKIEEVAEERIEVTFPKYKIETLVRAIRAAHPYEEPAIDVYPLIEI